MKIIKFEAYNSFENEFYEEISDEEVYNILQTKNNIPETDIDKIKSIFNHLNESNKIKIIETRRAFGAGKPYEIYFKISRSKEPTLVLEILGVEIIGLIDEWYIVSFKKSDHSFGMYSLYASYKCDQFNGLKQCIEDELG